MKYPLLGVTLCYAGGIIAGFCIGLSVFWLPLIAGGVALAAWCLSRRRAWLLWPLLFFTGWANYAFHTAAISPADLRRIFGEEPALATVRGRICETPSLRVFTQNEKEVWSTQVRLEVSAVKKERGEWQPAVGKLVATAPLALTNLFGGQIVEVSGVIGPPKDAFAEGTFDFRKLLQMQEIYFLLRAPTVEDWQIIQSPAKPPLVDRFREWARPALARGMPADSESVRLQWALTLGWKTALTEEVSEPYVQAATYHIFAVDGLRMAIIFGIFFVPLRRLHVPREIAGACLLVIIWFYVALTGWPASAIRATVMLSIVIVGWMLKRPTQLLNSLFVAAFLILLFEPQQLFQAGFQLSFFVVFFMIFLTEPIDHWVKSWFAPDPLLPEELRYKWPKPVAWTGRFVMDLTVSSFAAWIGSLALVAYYFNIVSFSSTPANIVAVFLCILVLACNILSLLLAAWFPQGSILLNHAGSLLMSWISVTSKWFADAPASYLYVPTPTFFTCAVYYAVLFAVVTGWLFRAKFRKWRIVATTALVAIWAGYAWYDAQAARITVLPLNGGMAVYYNAPGMGHDLLVDCGTTNSFQFMTKPLLRVSGVNKLPAFVMTHGDIRHIGAAEWAVEAAEVQSVCVSTAKTRSQPYRRAMAEFEKHPRLVRTISNGDHLDDWTVMHPARDDGFTRADDNAVVLMSNVKGTRILQLSDLGTDGQKALVERGADLKADIVITGLPAQGEALSEALLDAVQPRVIIVADSELPPWERASAKLQSRLALRKIQVIYTRTTGAVTIELRNGAWKIFDHSSQFLNGK